MENEIGIPSSLVSPPKKDFMPLAKSQLGFMNMFAIPLFQGIADVLPTMQYTVDELELNKALFEKQVEEMPGMSEERRKRLTEGMLSPRSMSLAIQSEDDPSRKASAYSSDRCEMPENHAEMKKSGSSPPDQPTQIPNRRRQYKEVNGISSHESVASFSEGDPFHESENRAMTRNGKQRSSETTEGSSSAPNTADWQSQATSATTGKMPFSPSTQGTSIVSQDSIDGPSHAPATTVNAPNAYNIPLPSTPADTATSEEDSNGSTLKPDRSLRKKTSRFRMNALNIFRRSKAPSPSRGPDGGS